MSFILDALKKSETDRQQQTGAEFSSIPSSSGQPSSFKWLWILALLLVVNFAVLVGILMRPDKVADVPETVQPQPIEQPRVSEPSFEERVADAKQSQEPVTETGPDILPVEEQPAEAVSVAAPEPNRPRLMTIDELRLNGSLQMAELHLDIHVFADDPAERFVFINMTKHRENSQLAEGPVVAEITTDGVILEYQGRTFLLPRE